MEKIKQMYKDGKAIGPSYGSGISGPRFPKPEERDGRHYIIKIGNDSDGFGNSDEIKLINDRWAKRHIDHNGEYTAWYWEDSKKRPESGPEREYKPSSPLYIYEKVDGGKLEIY